jgi:hypothetical protein
MVRGWQLGGIIHHYLLQTMLNDAEQQASAMAVPQLQSLAVDMVLRCQVD